MGDIKIDPNSPTDYYPTITLNITGGEVKHAISQSIHSTININGDTKYLAPVYGHVYVNDGAKLTTNANYLTVSTGGTASQTTVNEGAELHITGGGTYNASNAPGTIDGNGHVYIDENTNTAHTISSKYLTIKEGVTLNSSGAYIKSPNITNNGILKLNTNMDSTALTSAINGSGYTTFVSGISYVKAAINQKILNPTGSTLRVNAANLNGEIVNNGTLDINFYNANTQLKNNITGSGWTTIYRSLNNNYTWTDDEGVQHVGVDLQNSRVFSANAGTTLTTNADHIKGQIQVDSGCYLILTGGTLDKNVTSAGITRINTNADVISNNPINTT